MLKEFKDFLLKGNLIELAVAFVMGVAFAAVLNAFVADIVMPIIGAIVGEFMSSSEGLGHAIFKAGSLYIIPKVFAALVATIVLALLLTSVVGRIERLLMPWRRIH